MTYPGAGAIAHPNELRAHIFRVEEGLGNAILLELPDGSCGVVDWGTQRDHPLETVLRLARGSRVRFVVASHDHADHTLGIARLLQACTDERIPVDCLVYPSSTLRPRCKLTEARIKAHQLKIRMIPATVRTLVGGRPEAPHVWFDDRLRWEVRILAPTDTTVAQREVSAHQQDDATGNRTSLVVIFAFHHTRPGDGTEGGGRVLLPGDATPATLLQASQVAKGNDLALDNQLFVVPHHGSGTGMPEWLEPSIRGIAVISSRTNSSKHPAPVTLERLVRLTSMTAPHRLFCTSYAHACRAGYAHLCAPEHRSLVTAGPCFGDVVVRVPRTGPASVASSSQAGNERRAYGACGHAQG